MPNKKNEVSDAVQVFLRIHAKTADLDLPWVRKTLELEGDQTVKENQEHEDIVTFDFTNTPPLKSPDELMREDPARLKNAPQWDELGRWYKGEFRSAGEWLRKKTVDQFEAIRAAGLCADLGVINYVGLFPSELLKEVLRLRLDFWIFPRLVLDDNR